MQAYDLKKKLTLMMILPALLVFYGITTNHGMGYSVTAVFVAVVITLLAAKEWKTAKKRLSAIERLCLREDQDLDQECRLVSELTGADRESVYRLWEAVAAFYGIPPRKIRASDRLDVLLSDIKDPDHDIYLSRIFLEGSARRVLGTLHLATWGDLLAEIRRLETSCNAIATETIDSEGVAKLVLRD
jgi:hypothetical protein